MKTNQNKLVVFLLLAMLPGQFFHAAQPATAARCDAALLVMSVTAPDGSVYSPNATFTKTWRLKNVGTCTWTTAYTLVFVSGAQMDAPSQLAIPLSVAPDSTVDLSLNMIAPAPAGHYRGAWQLKNADGVRFGTGATANQSFWADIVTKSGSQVTPTFMGDTYDFVSSKAQQWTSGAGSLHFPGTNGDARGFALKLTSAQLETGLTVNQPALLMVPQKKTNGYIQALYPAIAIRKGDRFQATIGCEYGATSCYLTYRLDVRTSAGVKKFWTFSEKYDNQTYDVNLDLSSLAGKNVEFFLMVLATGSPTGDRALWVAPRITRFQATATPSATPTLTATPTPAHANWLTYSNPEHQFQFQYPPEGQPSTDQGGLVTIALPFQPGTNLTSKYLQVSADESVLSCSSLPVNPEPSEPVIFNGITFHKASGQDQGAGQIRDWTTYYTIKGTTCISIGFVLHSGTIGAFPTPISEFDFAAESVVFSEIMNSFRWLDAP